MLSTLRHLIIVALICTALPAHALQVEAEGSAAIVNGDIEQARRSAIADARQAAALQSAAYISATQAITNGVLDVDTLELRALGEVKNVKTLDEWIQGSILFVRIQAEVYVEQGCESGLAPLGYRKSLALTLFPLQSPAQASSGDLGTIQSALPGLIADALADEKALDLLKLTHVNLVTDPASAPTLQLPEGRISNALQSSESMRSQFILSGVIRDMSMRTPVGPREPNILVDLYNQADYASQRHLRNLSLELFLYDGFSGELIEQKSFNTQGRWTRPREERTGFATAPFWQQDYGQNTRKLITEVRDWLSSRLRCEPFAARITRTEGDRIWIDAGSRQGLKKGDKLSIYRRMTHYDDQMRSYSELSDTHETLTLDLVQPGLARGRIPGDSLSQNIQRDDIVMSR
ncbi:Flagellar protein FlgT [Marinobacterium lacunae]|uniref:Flagellar protein FlgT n=1 Tax=Marinobacterium lacunae TaxID=1232683 RepID=A0A081G0S8_9GAMM|nr:flagellar assembly protein T N-terminal domain-containing protein [Marinobacterium lacunae]KEA64383.1 Flagellar protein FlgT [Marinobacterium lacunae]